MEFGNEMQETFQMGINADLGSARKSGASQERNNIVQNFGNQTLDLSNKRASTKGFVSAAQRGYERAKLPQSKSQLSKHATKPDVDLGHDLLRHGDDSQNSPRKHSVLVKRASGPIEGIKRTSSGLEGAGGVKIGEILGTGTNVARDRLSQNQVTNAEYASDGQMRSTMYITNAMGGQNYLGYP